MIVLVDNYDSFTHNLAQYLGTFTEVKVIRNDAKNLFEELEKASGIVLSPGPGWPSEAGNLEKVIEHFYRKKAMLGICLGHQAIVEVLGGKLILAKETMHGKESQVTHTGESEIFQEIPREFTAMRYHSIVVEEASFPSELRITSRSEGDAEIMSFEHEKLNLFGLQFHPESISTPEGLKMIENFVKITNNEEARK
ncbi:anthranilate synthase component 2 [Pilibacter termitis]|uniref:Anthranilate synthase component 2 n=1 Tax=Pilibacter termitis TaxID=263852 RepID=A0A1T4QCG3_9ENTE|nr:aminodeoxychorismate/anthranilate synthase component II [Pilibacter termitis]SKA01327.1 anthranilate synthase component 2 [Pilibacter termitis]